MSKSKIDINDERWGGYIPWFLRHEGLSSTGNFKIFFERLSHRLVQLFGYNEAGISNLSYFGHMLESKSLQRFRFKDGGFLDSQINEYFGMGCVKRASDGIGYVWDMESIKERLGVLEVLLRLLPKIPNDLVSDIRSYFAESGIMLDIDTKTLEVKILEEPLLQKEVIDRLLLRLSSRFPERAKELIQAYHDMLGGEKEFDDIFVNAVKTVEEIGRTITEDKNFVFKKEFLGEYFPKLHPTIHETMIKLAAHRGDKGAHGRDKPHPHEMRYLLFSICNIALLMLDYPQV